MFLVLVVSLFLIGSVFGAFPRDGSPRKKTPSFKQSIPHAKVLLRDIILTNPFEQKKLVSETCRMLRDRRTARALKALFKEHLIVEELARDGKYLVRTVDGNMILEYPDSDLSTISSSPEMTDVADDEGEKENDDDVDEKEKHKEDVVHTFEYLYGDYGTRESPLNQCQEVDDINDVKKKIESSTEKKKKNCENADITDVLDHTCDDIYSTFESGLSKSGDDFRNASNLTLLRIQLQLHNSCETFRMSSSKKLRQCAVCLVLMRAENGLMCDMCREAKLGEWRPLKNSRKFMDKENIDMEKLEAKPDSCVECRENGGCCRHGGYGHGNMFQLIRKTNVLIHQISEQYIRHDKVDEVVFLLKEKINVMLMKEVSRCLYFLAAKWGALQILKYLVENINEEFVWKRDTNGLLASSVSLSVIEYAAGEGKYPIVEYLIMRCPELKNTKTWFGWAPVDFAIAKGHKEITELLGSSTEMSCDRQLDEMRNDKNEIMRSLQLRRMQNMFVNSFKKKPPPKRGLKVDTNFRDVEGVNTGSGFSPRKMWTRAMSWSSSKSLDGRFASSKSLDGRFASSKSLDGGPGEEDKNVSNQGFSPRQFLTRTLSRSSSKSKELWEKALSWTSGGDKSNLSTPRSKLGSEEDLNIKDFERGNSVKSTPPRGAMSYRELNLPYSRRDSLRSTGSSLRSAASSLRSVSSGVSARSATSSLKSPSTCVKSAASRSSTTLPTVPMIPQSPRSLRSSHPLRKPAKLRQKGISPLWNQSSPMCKPRSPGGLRNRVVMTAFKRSPMNPPELECVYREQSVFGRSLDLGELEKSKTFMAADGKRSVFKNEISSIGNEISRNFRVVTRDAVIIIGLVLFVWLRHPGGVVNEDFGTPERYSKLSEAEIQQYMLIWSLQYMQ